jgi:type IV secretory pathway TrbL component
MFAGRQEFADGIHGDSGPIYGQVGKLGLKRSGQKQAKRRSREEFADLDAKISETWPTLVKSPKGT